MRNDERLLPEAAVVVALTQPLGRRPTKGLG